MTPEQQAQYNATGLCPKCSSPTMYYCSAATPGECPLQDDDDEAPEAAPPVDPVIEKIKSIRRDIDSACDVFRDRPSDQDLGQAIQDLCGVVEAIYAGINAVLDDQSAKAPDPDPIIAAEHIIVERDGEWFVTPPASLWGYDTADDMRAAEGFGPAEQTMTDFFYSTTGETARDIVVAIIEQGRAK